jgi:hypothetical protein
MFLDNDADELFGWPFKFRLPGLFELQTLVNFVSEDLFQLSCCHFLVEVLYKSDPDAHKFVIEGLRGFYETHRHVGALLLGILNTLGQFLNLRFVKFDHIRHEGVHHRLLDLTVLSDEINCLGRLENNLL